MLVPKLERGIRAFHEAPVEACPFDLRVDAALEQVGQRVHPLLDDLLVKVGDWSCVDGFESCRVDFRLNRYCPGARWTALW